MGKFVLDRSVGLKALVVEEDSDRAIAVQQAGHELLAPDIYPLELANVITKLCRRNQLPPAEAEDMLARMLNPGPTIKHSSPLVPRGIEISLETHCAFWDALYVALAELENCPLLTADERLYHNLKDRYNVVTLASLEPAEWRNRQTHRT